MTKKKEKETDAPVGGALIRVRATKDGQYDDRLLRAGDTFWLHPREGIWTEKVLDADGEPKLHPKTKDPITREVKRVLTAEEQFSEKWMEKVPADTPDQLTTSQQVIQREHDALLAGKAGGGNPEGRPTGEGAPLD